MTTPTLSAVSLISAVKTEATQRAESDASLALTKAMAACRRAGYGDAVAEAERAAAYEAWMVARAANADRFAVSLGYTPDGWSYDLWLHHHVTTWRKTA